MKFIAAVALASSASAFAPASSVKKATTGPLQAVPYPAAYECAQDNNDKWQYKPRGGIGETEFYPQYQAGNRMPAFFPAPTETVGEATPVAEGAPVVPFQAAAPYPAAYESAHDNNAKWQYRPRGGIDEASFYPESHAGNRMPTTFFPAPTETVGQAPPVTEGAPVVPFQAAVPYPAAYESAHDNNAKWQYRPRGGIDEAAFYPQYQAGNRMPNFFPAPTETVGQAPPVAESAPAAQLPEAAPVAPMPEVQTSVASAPAEA